MWACWLSAGDHTSGAESSAEESCLTALWSLIAPGSRPTPGIGGPYPLESGYLRTKGATRTHNLWDADSFSCLSNEPQAPIWDWTLSCQVARPGGGESGEGRKDLQLWELRAVQPRKTK